MKLLTMLLAAVLLATPAVAAPQGGADDFKIVKNEVKDGVRYITAKPSAKVCSKQIDIQIDVKTDTIKDCVFTGGCPGNAIGLCNLIRGMKVTDAIKKLEGVNCAGRGTSCPDQLAKVLKAIKK